MMTSKNEPDQLRKKKVCALCTQDNFLRREIRRDGKRAKCSYCGRRTKVMEIGDFAAYIQQALLDHYEQTSDDYPYDERPGEPVSWVIQEAALIDESVAEDVRAILEDRSGVGSDKDTMYDENPYSEEAHYQEKGVGVSEYHEEWEQFRKSILTEARLFNRQAEIILDEIFEGLEGHVTRQGQKLIVDAGPGRKISTLFRARAFQSDQKLETAIGRPDIELGPPSSVHAVAGRMNSKGIAVFYGATHPGVALAEIRPPVGSRVLVGRFQIIRPLRLLDLEAMQSIKAKGSIFERPFVQALEKSAFLHILSENLTRPVMPDDEASEYLVTQAIADYLATRKQPLLDGIIYPSAQQHGKLKRNVVLFHKSSRVEDLGLPRHTKIIAHVYEQDEDGIRPDYWVAVTVPPKKEKVKKVGIDWLPDPLSRYPEHGLDTREPTLRIDLHSLKVKHIKSVKIEADDFSITRNEYEMSDTELEKLQKKEAEEFPF